MGTLLNSVNTTAVTRTAAGITTVPTYLDYQNDIAAGTTTLGPGTYWLGLHNGPLSNTARAEFYLETTSNPTDPTLGQEYNLQLQNGFKSSGNNHAFELINNSDSAPVPEASTTVSMSLLLALGLGGFVVATRRRRASGTAQ